MLTYGPATFEMGGRRVKTGYCRKIDGLVGTFVDGKYSSTYSTLFVFAYSEPDPVDQSAEPQGQRDVLHGQE